MLITSTRRSRFTAAGALMVAFTAGCGTQPTDTRPVDDASLTRQESPAALPPVFYVDPASPAANQVSRWAAEGRSQDVTELAKISGRPAAKWMTDQSTAVANEVDAFVGRAAIAGQVPVLVAYNLPHQACGRFSTGGAPSADAYRSWIREFATGLRDRPAIVILEPNAVADAIDGCVDDVGERYALLNDAIAVLKSTGSARVYLDAGHPLWIKDPRKVADALNRAGVTRADGFALNVGSFVRTADNVAYGHRVSDALGGGAHFVIDTSRNGNGPYPGDSVNGGPSWCNPPDRMLGEAPTDNPGLDRVDALLWIKYPGESDGPCRPGEPETGNWWPEYALDLAGRSS